MDKLVKESTGFYAIPSGELACVLTRISGKNTTHKWFTYKPTFFAEPVKLVEDIDTTVSLFPADVTKFIVAKGYARHPSESEVSSYNEGIDSASAKAAADKAAADKAAADKAAADKAAADKAAADKAAADKAAADKAAADKAAADKAAADKAAAEKKAAEKKS